MQNHVGLTDGSGFRLQLETQTKLPRQETKSEFKSRVKMFRKKKIVNKYFAYERNKSGRRWKSLTRQSAELQKNYTKVLALTWIE